jgi:hypothetical protein
VDEAETENEGSGGVRKRERMSDNPKVTLSPATDAEILSELRWACADVNELKTALGDAEYESEQWYELLKDYRITVKRVSRLMRALSKGRVTETKQ